MWIWKYDFIVKLKFFAKKTFSNVSLFLDPNYEIKINIIDVFRFFKECLLSVIKRKPFNSLCNLCISDLKKSIQILRINTQ